MKESSSVERSLEKLLGYWKCLSAHWGQDHVWPFQPVTLCVSCTIQFYTSAVCQLEQQSSIPTTSKHAVPALPASPRAAPHRCRVTSAAPPNGPAMAETEETLKRIQAHKGVVATMVVNAEGIPIRTTLDNSTTVHYAGLLHQLTMKARSTVRDIDPQNDLTFLRIRSKKHEIMVAPDKEYLLIVIQNPSE
ncbi:dynein light chain roadblock-type 2 [Phasianus colchicus]|nr:dynein light chain roadblock-type 2 [Phasianus colchicus]